MLSISRSEVQQPFAASDARFLEVLIPYVRQAVALHQRLTVSEAVVTTLTEVVNASAGAVLFVTARGEVTFLNEAAARLVASNDGLSIERGELRASTATATRHLRVAVDNATNVQRLNARGATVVLQRPSGKRPLAAHVFPMREPHAWHVPGTTVASVFISDPDRASVPEASVLRAVFGLTSAECALAILLARGVGLSAAADSLCITRETVRSRLKVLFEKTGTHRQADLVRLLLQYAVEQHPNE